MLRRRGDSPPRHLRIETYGGHGRDDLVIRGRTLDNPLSPAAAGGDGVWAAANRMFRRFATNELPGVVVQVRVGGRVGSVTTDDEGYFEIRTPGGAEGPWAEATIGLAAPYRGITSVPPVTDGVRVSDPDAAFGVISDIDDTVLHTGAQRTLSMMVRTFFGSALTRAPLAGAATLYRALAKNDHHPVFYVSSSPWNLHGFLTRFLDHRGFPPGPLLLRDLLGSGTGRTHASTKLAAIAEILDLHPGLRFVLIGDSGQHDPEIYATAIRRNPDRFVAAYIREVRLDPGDGRVEAVLDSWDHDIPIVLSADSAAMADHAAALGLISSESVVAVTHATRR